MREVCFLNQTKNSGSRTLITSSVAEQYTLAMCIVENSKTTADGSFVKRCPNVASDSKDDLLVFDASEELAVDGAGRK